MAAIITDPVKDIAKINSEFARLDVIEREMDYIKQRINGQKIELDQHESSDRPVTTNNVTYTWTGGTTTLSWGASYIKGKDGSTHSIPAGSKVLNASTFYWIYWNPYHQVKVFESSDTKQNANPNNILIGQIFTGTALQTGTAGGGGSESPGYGTSGSKYKLF